jgi:probable HAF family extracellular repeat protein
LLPGPAGADGDVRAVALNELGQAVGTVTGEDGVPHAVLWTTRSSGTEASDLGTLAGGDRARATGINNAGFVVGDSTIASGRSHAFLYDPAKGKLLDLNTLVDAPQFSIRHASAVNNLTYIAGEAVGADGWLHGVLLIPKDPLPALPVGISESQGRVTVNGGSGDDHIVVRHDPAREGKWLVSLNDEGQKFTVGTFAALLINGGPGDDRVDVTVPANSFLSVDVFGQTGNDRVTLAPGGTVNLFADGGDGDDRIAGNERSTCFLKGGAGADTLIGGASRDVLWGGFGDDRIVGGGGGGFFQPEDLRGESGDDTITGGVGTDRIRGGAGDDQLDGGGDDDWLMAGPGTDTVDGAAGNDGLFGNEGDDLVRGGEGDDLAYGDQGDDTVLGQSGDDTLGGDQGFAGDLANLATQFPGDDLLDGGRGRDHLLGSRESVTFADDNGTDTMTGGAGGDVIDARGDDVASDVTADDVVPVRQRIGTGALAVQQSATLTITASANERHVRVGLLPLPAGTGQYNGSPMYLDAGGVLRMQDTVDRRFTLGEFFRNWGVPIGRRRFGRFFNANVNINGEKVGGNLDNYVVRNGDVIRVLAEYSS